MKHVQRSHRLRQLLSIVLSLTMIVSCCLAGSTGAFAATSAHELSAAADTDTFVSEFQNPTVKSGSSIRYWLMNTNISPEQIDQELQSIADAGFASIEMTWVQNFDSDHYNTNDYGWGSENWMKTVENVLKAGKKCGLEIDILYSNRWPAGIPFDNDDYASMTNEEITAALDQDYSAKQMSYQSRVLCADDFVSNGDGTYSFAGDVPVAAALSYGKSDVKFTLHPIAFTVAKTEQEAQKTIETTNMWGQVSQKTIVQAALDPESMTDITSSDRTCASWTIDAETFAEIQAGQWTIFGFYWQSAGQTNKKESVAYTGVIDHYSVQGSNALIHYWESMLTEEARDLLKEVGGDFFEDSLELAANVNENSTDSRTGTFIPWTEDTELGVDALDQFKKSTGYDLTPYLPLLVGSYGSKVQKNTEGYEVHYDFTDHSGERVVEEYKRVMSDLMMENHMDVMNEWSHSVGMNFRVQAYITTNEEGGIDFIDAASRVDTIEGETLAFAESNAAGGYDSFRYLSGGAHIAGKQIISDEVGAMFGGYINSETCEELVSIVNRNVASGVNQFVLHGYASRYEFINTTANKWPGWAPFDESSNYKGVYEAWGERNPVWENFEVIGDYMSRIQTVTQAGTAKKDLVFYYDKLTAKQTDFNTDDGNILSQNGYDYEFLSPRVLDEEHAYVEDGVLAPESAAYRAMIFNHQEDLSLETLSVIRGYAENGLPVIFLGDLPGKVTSYANYEADCASLKTGLQDLLKLDNVYQISSEEELVPLLKGIGIEPAANYEASSQLVTIHRNDSGKADYYWMYNRGSEEESLDITFAGNGTPYALDLWTGEITPIAQYTETDGTVTLHMTVEAGGAAAIALTDLPIGQSYDVHVVSGTADSYSYDKTGAIIAHAAKAGEYPTTLSNGETVTVSIGQDAASVPLKDAGWSLNVESWTQDESDPKGLSTLKTDLPSITLDSLAGWSHIEGLETVSGNAVYTAVFSLDAQPDSALFNLTTAEGTVAITGVTVNGQEIRELNQSTKQLEIASFLHEGENLITVSISTGLSNARKQETTREYGLIDASLTIGRTAVVYEPHPITITAPDSVQVNDDFVVTVITPVSVHSVALFNEYGLQIGVSQSAFSDNGDGTRTWALTASLGTVGQNRTLTLAVQGAEGYYTDSGKQITLSVTSVPPVLSSFTLPDSAVANRTFLVKATTDMSATKIAVYNEFGTKMGIKSLSYKIVDGQKVWTGVMSVGTKGERTFTAYAVDKYGAGSNTLTGSVSVKACA